MTEQEINQKALEVYPYKRGLDSINNEFYDLNFEGREGYIKAFKEIELLQKIKGWVARDHSGNLFLFQDTPVRKNKWWIAGLGGFYLSRKSFPELTWENEPIEVEILIRKV